MVFMHVYWTTLEALSVFAWTRKTVQYRMLIDRQFSTTREALLSQRKQLRRAEKDQRTNKAAGLSEDEIQCCEKKNSWKTIPRKVFWVPSGSTTLCSLARGLIINTIE